jgi:hypothetical protein
MGGAGAGGASGGMSGKGGSGVFGGTAGMDGGTSGKGGAAGMGGASGTGGSAGAGGASGKGGSAGAGGGAGKGGGAGTGSGTVCMNPRMPTQAGNSGGFGTTGAVCYFVDDMFNTWACSNLGGRMVSVNGGTPSATCGGTLPARIDGGYYFEFTMSTSGVDYTSFYWYSS